MSIAPHPDRSKVSPPLLRTSGLTVKARGHNGASSTLIDAVDLIVESQRIVGLIGESGSGKTTVTRSLIGLLAPSLELTAGNIEFDGQTVFDAGVDRRYELRGSSIGMVFQSASRSLNPVIRIGSHLKETINRADGRLGRQAMKEACRDVLRGVALPDTDRIMRAYPHQLSGGMRQRVAIALALATRPRLIIADESTSALDVTTQAEIVRLFGTLRQEQRIAIIFVTHDLLLASDLCDDIVVMSKGQVVERGTSAQVLSAPEHPYSRFLVSATPKWSHSAVQPVARK